MIDCMPFSFAPNLDTTIVRGDVASGKSQSVLESLAKLNESEPDSAVLVCAATPSSRDMLSQRARDLLGEDAIQQISFVVPWEIALSILAESDEYPYYGHPRITDATDRVFLMEDLKSLGLKPSRLREMLKFFYRTWSMMEDEDPSWLMEGEEAHVHDYLRSQLDFRGALMPDEVSNRAMRHLLESDGDLSANGYDHVFIDDAQLLSRASQILICALARKTLYVTGNDEALFEAFESYPYADVFKELLDAIPSAEVIMLEDKHQADAAYDAMCSIRRVLLERDSPIDDSSELQMSDVQWFEGADPGEEIGYIAGKIAELITAGVAPDSILVASPNALWTSNLIRALNSIDISSSSIAVRTHALGDVRNVEKCHEALFLTALDLIANPADSLAWRAWCGYGDYLTNSVAIAALFDLGRASLNNLNAILNYVTEFPAEMPSVVGMREVADAYSKGLELIAGAEDLKGEALIQYIMSSLGITAPSQQARIKNLFSLDDELGDLTAQAVSHRIHRDINLPTLARCSKDTVLVVPYSASVGLIPDYLFAGGLVNGLTPPRKALDDTILTREKQQRVIQEQAYVLSNVIGKASSSITLSWFRYCSPEIAKRLDIVVDRILVKDGERVCRVDKSIYLDAVITE